MVLGLMLALALQGQAAQRARAEAMSGDALRSGARLQLVSGQHPGARASLRGALEIGDSREARRLWMQLQGKPLLWERALLNTVRDIWREIPTHKTLHLRWDAVP